MARKLNFDEKMLDAFAQDSTCPREGRLDGAGFRLGIVIPAYRENVERHYADLLRAGFDQLRGRATMGNGLRQFGLLCEFAEPVELEMHDSEMVLDTAVRALVARFGPVVLANAYLDEACRERSHRNIFPHLRFHSDRGPDHPNQYSLFTRDPFDPEQAPPRQTSTLFAANAVAYLQALKEQGREARPEGMSHGSYDIFGRQRMDEVIGSIVLEQAWSRPHGTGEICVIDNRTVLHASYHRDRNQRGYRIGARYLI
jgi:hypothetical protein